MHLKFKRKLTYTKLCEPLINGKIIKNYNVDQNSGGDGIEEGKLLNIN
jgi:hypothetical protein